MIKLNNSVLDDGHVVRKDCFVVFIVSEFQCDSVFQFSDGTN